MCEARFAKLPPGSSSQAKNRPNSALSRYCSCPMARKTTSGTNAMSRNSTARGQLRPVGSNREILDSQLLAVGLSTGCPTRPLAPAMTALARLVRPGMRLRPQSVTPAAADTTRPADLPVPRRLVQPYGAARPFRSPRPRSSRPADARPRGSGWRSPGLPSVQGAASCGRDLSEGQPLHETWGCRKPGERHAYADSSVYAVKADKASSLTVCRLAPGASRNRSRGQGPPAGGAAACGPPRLDTCFPLGARRRIRLHPFVP